MERKFLQLTCVGVLLISGFVSVLPGGGQVPAGAGYTRPEIDFEHFPIVDLEDSSPSDEVAKAIRARKSKKYNDQSLSKISEEWNSSFVVNETISNLSALPSTRVHFQTEVG